MEYQVKAEVDRELSVDPSYIVRYQVFRNGRFMGDGVVQYHREAEENDIPLTGLPGSEELTEEEKRYIRHQIASAAIGYLSTRV